MFYNKIIKTEQNILLPSTVHKEFVREVKKELLKMTSESSILGLELYYISNNLIKFFNYLIYLYRGLYVHFKIK